MPKMDETSPEISIPVRNSSDEELLHFTCSEKENFRSFRALKEDSTNDTHQSPKPRPLIRRVRAILRENENFKRYFEPRVVAIGPLHHRNTQLQSAEKTKLKLAVLFTKAHGVAEHVLYKKIKEVIGYLKEFYKTKDIEDYKDDELAWMFFVDGCAVLHAIHYITTKDVMPHDVKVDLLVFALVDMFMLENQIPFQVLELLMNSVDNGKALRESIYSFIDDKIKGTLVAAGNSDQQQRVVRPEQDQDPIHLLDLLRERLLTKPDDKETNTMIGKMLMSWGSKRRNSKTFRSVNELKEAGIVVRPSETSSLRDVNFRVNFLATLNIPRIVVDSSTGSKFMNLVAYEMCPGFKNDFGVTSYLCFLESLIDTARDVKELRHAGMLLNYMGSDEEVAHFFNNITTDLVLDTEMYHQQVTDDIRRYCDCPLATYSAKMYYTYFSAPWSLFAFWTATLGLVFAAMQIYHK